MRGETCQAPPASASCQPPVNREDLPHARCVAGCGNAPAFLSVSLQMDPCALGWELLLD